MSIAPENSLINKTITGDERMKRLFILTVFAAALLLLNGCSGTEASDKHAVKSGGIDETYIGDPDPELIENYKQSKEEADIQAEVLRKLEEKAETDAEQDQ